MTWICIYIYIYMISIQHIYIIIYIYKYVQYEFIVHQGNPRIKIGFDFICVCHVYFLDDIFRKKRTSSETKRGMGGPELCVSFQSWRSGVPMASPVAVSCQVGVMFSHGNDGENYDENDGR